MNQFGTVFTLSIFGESHGPEIGVLIDGCPPGISIQQEDFEPDLARRRSGAAGTTPRKEADIPRIKSGVFNGYSTGAPICISFENKDVDSSSYDKIKNTPRPGHSDFVAHHKYKGFNDYRGGGHFSGRLTACLVAAGVVAKKVISPVTIEAKLTTAGGSNDIAAAVQAAVQDGDSIGGIVSCVVSSLPCGLGEPFFNSVESLLSHAVFAIPAIKGIEFGSGFSGASMRGSEHNDDILDSQGRTATNNAGGINGGITNGNDVTFQIAVKPTSSIKKTKGTIDLRTGEQTAIAVEGRHDACIALRVPPVLEAVTAFVFADLLLVGKRYGA